MERKFKQWWSTNPPTSTKRTITSDLWTITSDLWTRKGGPRYMMLKIQVLSWDRDTNVL